jgi:ankyrin repeat protein
MVATGGGVPPDFSAVDYAKAVSEKCAALSIKYLGDAESIINCIKADGYRQLADITTRADGKERGLMLLLACIHGAFHCVLDLGKEGFAVPYVDMGLGDGIPGCSSLVELASQFGQKRLTIILDYLDSVGGGAAFDVPSALFEAAYQHPNGLLECLLRDEDTRRSVNTANSRGLLPLMMASPSAVPLLVEAGADVNLVHGDTGTALYHACHFASLEKVKALVECGADENRAGPGGKTPLMAAAKKTQANIVAYLLGRPDIDIEAKAADGDRAINFACFNKHLGVVKLLVGAGAKVNAQPTDKRSPPLVSAVLGGDLQVVKYLVECGADVTYRCSYGFMPLLLAARDGHIDIVEYLLGRPGVNIEAKNEDGERTIDIACRNNHLDVVKLLIAAGANIEPQGNDEQGALAAAAMWGHLQVVKYLVEETGADENRAGYKGWTPLMAAARRGQVDVMQYLLGRPSINIEAQSEGGERAIDIACCEGHVEVVKLLVAAGARVDPEDSDEGLGPLTSAVIADKLDVVKYLVEEAGADASRTGKNGVTPLTWARRTCHTDVANYLQTIESQREHEVSVLQLA